MSAACEPFDRALLAAAGRPKELSVLPTALVRNGSVASGMARARRYFGRRFGVGVQEVRLHRRSDASRPGVVEQLRDSPLTYILGGDPGYLLDTLLGSPAWAAICDSLRDGAAVAGSSAGAMVVGETLLLRSRNPSPAARHGREGLHLLPRVVVVPHLNRFGRSWLDAARREARGSDIVGLDESTGLIYARGWTVHGPGHVNLWRLGAEQAQIFGAGARPRWRVPRL